MFERIAKQCSATWTILLVSGLLLSVILPGSASVNYAITRVSVSSSGEQSQATGEAIWFSDISDDGRVVTFHSGVSNLVPGDTNNVLDVFTHDLLTGETARVSVTSDGKQGNLDSKNPSLSADGRYVAFESQSALVAEDVNEKSDVYVHDRYTKKTTLASISSTGQPGNSSSFAPSISADGMHVAFHSEANNLVEGDTAGMDVFVRDRQDGLTTRVSVSTTGEQSNAFSAHARISANGNIVVFGSSATTLAEGNPQGRISIFVRNRVTKVTKIVSVSPDGKPANDHSDFYADVSDDGSTVAFVSRATNLVADDSSAYPEVFVNDLATGHTSRILSSTGGQVNNVTLNPSLSGDGKLVSFSSTASNLLVGRSLSGSQVYIYDRQARQSIPLSVSITDEPGNKASSMARLSANGKYASFVSEASNLVAGDTNGIADYFVFDRSDLPSNPTQSTISGVVIQPGHQVMAGVTVTINGTNYTTNSQGTYIATGLVTGTYTVSVTSETAVFTPTVRTVTIPPGDTQANFEQVCVSPYTGLNVCELEVGDILFYSHADEWKNILAKTFVGTYWFHAALYAGGGQVVHANGVQRLQADEVIHTSIYGTYFWLGFDEEYMDWTVLRPKASQAQKQGAVDYAVTKANDPQVTYVETPWSIPGFLDRGSDNQYSCSEFVWKAYHEKGYTMEVDVSLWRWAYPQFNLLVTPDDLYFSQYLGMADAVQLKEPSSLNKDKMIFYLLSPADMLLTDSEGRKVGSNPISGEQFAEMPNAWHYNQQGLPEVIVAQGGENESWKLQIAGTGEGNYTLQVVNFGATELITETATFTTSVGKIDSFSVSLGDNNIGNTPIKLTHESSTMPDMMQHSYLPLVAR